MGFDCRAEFATAVQSAFIVVTNHPMCANHGVTVGNRAQNMTNAAAITTTATAIQTESLIG